jgi:hypothetical protein
VSSPPAAPSPSDSVIYIYSHGFTNGVYRVEPGKDTFEKFLEYCNRVDRIKELRILNEKAIAETELKLTVANAANASSTNMLIEKENSAEHVSRSLTEFEQSKGKKDQQEKELIVQAKETVTEYSWVPAIFYFAAGIIFITADISITHQITAYGFNMAGWQGWIFAIGLAFTAFLIKPAIDRMLEKPFQAAGLKLKMSYKIVLFSITAIGLVMLFFLGRFRSDSEIASTKMQRLNEQMNVVDVDSPRSKALQEEYDKIQKDLDENPMGKTGLIMSGMLFAVGGAICLSIAFGALKQLINRYWILPVRIGQVKKEIKGLDKQLNALRSEHTAIKSDQEKARQSIQTNDHSLLREELKILIVERSALITSFYEAQNEKERALYLDGRNKGDKYGIEGDLLYKVHGNDHSALYLGKQDGKKENESSTSVRPYTRRPFVKMRKMIADNFNKNQNNQSYDGSEFEILS